MSPNRTPRKAVTVAPSSSPLAYLKDLKPDSAKPAELAPTARPREGSADFGPFIEWLHDSYKRFKAGTKPDGYTLSIPEASATATAGLVRRCAASLGYGVNIQTSKPHADGNVSFSFKAKDPVKRDESKPRRPVRKDKWTDSEYLAATNAWLTSEDPTVGIVAWLTANGLADKIDVATAKAREDVKELRASMAAAKAAAKTAETAPAPVKAAPAPVRRAG